MNTSIIGIDCATDPKRIGLARGRVTADGLVLDRLGKVGKGEPVAERVVDWMANQERVLLAVDAPLGWPAALGDELVFHRAGDFLPTLPNQLFRRETDRFTHRQIGKLPLDVGADRIARTAHAALSLLHQIAERRRCVVPLAWSPAFDDPVAAIEVYPAAVLKTSGMPFQGYKGPAQAERRAEIASLLARQMTFATDNGILLSDDDVLDGVVCVLAGGVDLVSGWLSRPVGGPPRAEDFFTGFVTPCCPLRDGGAAPTVVVFLNRRFVGYQCAESDLSRS